MYNTFLIRMENRKQDVSTHNVKHRTIRHELLQLELIYSVAANFRLQGNLEEIYRGC